MSQQFCYPSTPNIEAEAFRLLALFDKKIDAADFAALEALIEASINSASSRVAQLETEINELRKFVMQVRCSMT